MENAARSQRTREAALEAALAILGREGAAKLTIDAIAKESGISKGGVLHQFRTKEAVIRALLERQICASQSFNESCLAGICASHPEPLLSAKIETLRIASTHRDSVTMAVLAALAEAPDLLSMMREREAANIEAMQKQAADPDASMMRWAAAQGLALTAILGMSPLSDEERGRIFTYLQNIPATKKPSVRAKPAPRRKNATPKTSHQTV